AKSRYLANVSHEIRSPLNAIYGYAQLLERGSAVDIADAARVIRRSAEHLTDLVEGLLDISLVENGVMRVSTDTVRLPAFIEQVDRMFR
uniref:sensor histidine kinase n=1 Tax=Streptomyces galilaeus TaxID=33899 RepID=UPI0038F785C6